jgi:DNA-binding NtrC family response regulator
MMATILIIDDEEGIRALLLTTLDAAWYEVAQGLERYRHRPTDLV